jgi:hypothetical protein
VKRSSARRAGVVLGMALALGCAPRVAPEQPSPFEEDDPAALGAEPDDAGNAAPTPVAVAADRSDACPRARSGAGSPDGGSPDSAGGRRRHIAVPRAALQLLLDAGPGPLLRALEVKPRFRDNRFRGWEIVQFMPCETRFDGLDLRPGDIIGRVNQQPIARPEQLSGVWQTLRGADAITIEVSRPGEDFELRFEVAEQAKAAGP